MSYQQKEGIRAVFYSRVSTEEEKQINALEKQVQENKDTISSNGWRLVDEYIDEGKSGTQVKKRDEYQRLLEDMPLDKFDIIVIKDQERLMRNTRDWYLFVDRLVSNNLRLYMYLENSWYSPDNALITGIKAIMAEEYSRNLSRKINNSNKRRVNRALEGGELSIFSNSLCYGYDMVNGGLVINEEQAETVRLIYSLYLEGNGLRNIRRILTDRSIKNIRGNEMNEVTIGNILKNERYKGTLVSNKTHKDFETKKIIKNPKEEWIYFDDMIPPIVDKKIWEEVQEIMDSRRQKAGVDKRAVTFGKNVGNHPLSGKIFCSICDKPYWKRERAKENTIMWECSTYAKDGRKTKRQNRLNDLGLRDEDKGCDAPHINNEDIMSILRDIGDDLVVNRDIVKRDILKWLNSLLESVSSQRVYKSTLQELERQERLKNKLLDTLLEDLISKEDYKRKSSEIEGKIKELRSRVSDLENQNEDAKGIQRVIDNIDKEIDTYIGGEEFNEGRLEFLLQHLQKITVSGEHFIIELDLIGGAIIAGRDFFQYVQGTRQSIIHTGKVYKIKASDNTELTVVLKMVA